MNYSRYIALALLPFFAAAVIPWLAPNTVVRVLWVTLVWASVVVVFMAGLAAGDALAANAGSPAGKSTISETLKEEGASVRSRPHLTVLAAIACAVLAMLALACGVLWHPLLALVVMALTFFSAAKLLQSTYFWQPLNEQQNALFLRVIWLVLGCLLMLFLSYYRQHTLGV